MRARQRGVGAGSSDGGAGGAGACANRGLGVVRIKPLGAGGGGGEASAAGAAAARSLTFDVTANSVTVDGRTFAYPTHVMGPGMDNASVYAAYMPTRVAQFLSGVDANIVCYGQTGSGKTHTCFGPPRSMAKAAAGMVGACSEDFGLFPRALISIFKQVQARRARGERLSLTFSAVELAIDGNVDMLDTPLALQARRHAARSVESARQFLVKKNTMPSRGDGNGGFGHDWCKGVALDVNASPAPRLFGQNEHPLESFPADMYVCFAALATRNTAGTGLNDSSSRTHALASLTLRKYDPEADTVLTSTFKFFDLAGNERLKDAHGTKNWKQGGAQAAFGVWNNYTLSCLSGCIRNLVASRKTGSSFSFRSYLLDLPLLLQGSLQGSAATACFVCVSQADGNRSASKNALDFGAHWAQLAMAPRQNKPVARAEMLANCPRSGGAGGGGTGRYAALRAAQGRDGTQLRWIIEGLVKGASTAAAATTPAMPAVSTASSAGAKQDRESSSSDEGDGDDAERYRFK